MTSNYDDRDDERDWPEEEVAHKIAKTTPEPSVQPEPEDDAAHLPVPHTRRPQSRKRTSYRPPSELDRD